MVLPTQRLPTSNDAVILDKGTTDVTVTLSTGAHTIRKLTIRETLNISGGSLTVGYTPVADSTPLSAQFSAPVTLSGTGAFSAHTLQVDATRTFAANGGTLTVNTLNLMPHATTPAKLQLGGDITLSALAGATATIRNGTGTGTTGSIDLAGAERQITVTDGAAAIDASLETPIANGRLWKKGAGTLRLTEREHLRRPNHGFRRDAAGDQHHRFRHRHGAGAGERQRRAGRNRVRQRTAHG